MMPPVVEIVARAIREAPIRATIRGASIIDGALPMTEADLLRGQAAVDAHLSALTAAGLVIVPSEPTEAMLRAGEGAYWRKRDDASSPWPTEHHADGGGALGYAYRAMLAAAGAPQHGE